MESQSTWNSSILDFSSKFIYFHVRCCSVRDTHTHTWTMDMQLCENTANKNQMKTYGANKRKQRADFVDRFRCEYAITIIEL